MNEKNMSVLDAFLALEDLEDEEVKAPLKEGKGFNVRDDIEMDKAKDFVDHQEKKDVALEVIDVDADSLEHLKNNEQYVGQMILQCNSCKANRFINADDLVESEADSDVYNIEDECPHCHGKGTGFHLIGQVGKVESEEEVKAENDSLTDEPKFDNDFEEEQPAEEEPQEEEQPAETTSSEEPEDNGMETTAEDDTADMESTLGDEFDSDDVEWDDTEEKPEAPAEEDSLTNDDEDKYEEPLSLIEEPKEDEDKKKEEDLEEDIETTDQIVSDFIETIIEPENIEDVLVFDLDGEDEEQIFEGKFEDLPPDVLNAEFIGFDVGQGTLIINIDSDSEIDELTPTVANMLNKFTDDFNENISVWDQATGDEVFQGTKQSVLEEYGNEAFLSFEAPERLELKVRSLSLTDSLKTPYQEDLDFANPEEKLISNIIKENKLREYRVDKFGSEEYWIAESIKQREDLNHIFENYVKTKSNKLVLEFKDVTGYKDKFDLLNEEAESLTEDLEDEAREEAKKHFEDSEVESVIYGYESRGKFHRLQGDLLEIRNDRELRMATELVKAKYHPTGSVKVLYRDSVSESIDCKNRKELTEAILDCESKGIAYTIKRAVKEGYRYTLIKEEAERGFFADEEGEIESSDIDSRDIDLADTILRITDDIADTFNAKGAVTDKRLIAADILNDLEIITAEQSDKVKSVDPAENLRDVVIEVLTGLNNKIDRYAESEDENEVQWAEERKADFETLNGDTFTKDAIEARFQDIDASSAHDIPGVTFPEAETECLQEEVEDYDFSDSSNKELLVDIAMKKYGNRVTREALEDFVKEAASRGMSAKEVYDAYYRALKEPIPQDEWHWIFEDTFGQYPEANESLKESEEDEEDIGLVNKPADEIFGDDGISNYHSPEVYVDYFSDYGDDWASAYPELRFDIIEPGSASTSEIKIRVTGDEHKVREFIKAHNESIESLVEDGAIDEYCLDWLIDEDDIHEVELIESLDEGKYKYTVVYEIKGDDDYHYFDGNNEEKIKKDFIKYINDNGIELDSAELCTNDNEGNPKSPAIYTFKIEHNQVVESLDENKKKPFSIEFYDLDGSWQYTKKADSQEEAIQFGKDKLKAARARAGLGQDPNVCSFVIRDINDNEVYHYPNDDEFDESLEEGVTVNSYALYIDKDVTNPNFKEADERDSGIEAKKDFIEKAKKLEQEGRKASVWKFTFYDNLLDTQTLKSKEQIYPYVNENLDEAKKDDELPADPEVVKTNVHATLNNLVTDEIEAINGYEEAKAEIADTHIEHKDDIIDTIDHIEDEEQEHIDELIDAASEIPFEKEGHEDVKEEPIEEPEIEEEPELEPEDEETLDFDETKFESFINEWFNQNVEDTQVFEALKGNFTDDGTIILEGKLISEDKEQGVKFTLTPTKEMNEDLMNSKKVTTYTITSTSLPEGLVIKYELNK